MQERVAGLQPASAVAGCRCNLIEDLLFSLAGTCMRPQLRSVVDEILISSQWGSPLAQTFSRSGSRGCLLTTGIHYFCGMPEVRLRSAMALECHHVCVLLQVAVVAEGLREQDLSLVSSLVRQGLGACVGAKPDTVSVTLAGTHEVIFHIHR